MPKVRNTCRVCGNAYEACKSLKHNNTFRWQEVACSPECGAEYFRRIQISRGIISTESETDESVSYNEDIYGFDGEPDEDYIGNYGSAE